MTGHQPPRAALPGRRCPRALPGRRWKGRDHHTQRSGLVSESWGMRGGGGRPGRRGEGDTVGGGGGGQTGRLQSSVSRCGQGSSSPRVPSGEHSCPLGSGIEEGCDRAVGSRPPFSGQTESRESWELAFPVIHRQMLGHVWNIKEWEGAGVM